jgi:hypothetical protein
MDFRPATEKLAERGTQNPTCPELSEYKEFSFEEGSEQGHPISGRKTAEMELAFLRVS